MIRGIIGLGVLVVLWGVVEFLLLDIFFLYVYGATRSPCALFNHRLDKWLILCHCPGNHCYVRYFRFPWFFSCWSGCSNSWGRWWWDGSVCSGIKWFMSVGSVVVHGMSSLILKIGAWGASSKGGGIREFSSGWDFPTASNFPFAKLCRVIGIVSLIVWVTGIVWVEVVVAAVIGVGAVSVRVAGTTVTLCLGQS